MIRRLRRAWYLLLLIIAERPSGSWEGAERAARRYEEAGR